MVVDDFMLFIVEFCFRFVVVCSYIWREMLVKVKMSFIEKIKYRDKNLEVKFMI